MNKPTMVNAAHRWLSAEGRVADDGVRWLAETFRACELADAFLTQFTLHDRQRVIRAFRRLRRRLKQQNAPIG